MCAAEHPSPRSAAELRRRFQRLAIAPRSRPAAPCLRLCPSAASSRSRLAAVPQLRVWPLAAAPRQRLAGAPRTRLPLSPRRTAAPSWGHSRRQPRLIPAHVVWLASASPRHRRASALFMDGDVAAAACRGLLRLLLRRRWSESLQWAWPWASDARSFAKPAAAAERRKALNVCAGCPIRSLGGRRRRGELALRPRSESVRALALAAPRGCPAQMLALRVRAPLWASCSR
mmetsp:Transcript_70245/g.195526  ORF Transcript_70245/g.195526 Transcript_70245/m.195526 type:complete len:230 (+) Transcript_70245:45-734(+)